MPLQCRIENDTGLPLQNKISQIQACVQSIYGAQAELVSATCDDIGYKTPNFTTSGIFRLHGLAKLNGECKPWSAVLKIIKPDSAEKDNVEHHNYWRREAFVLESGILENLPNVVSAAKCYGVEEQEDGTVWLWMEYVEGHYAESIGQFTYIARQLGRYNGTYLTGARSVPEHEWICKAWLKSWTTASRMYAPDMEAYASHLTSEKEQNMWAWYKELLHSLDSALDSLQRLPRVPAHQDLGQKNMLLTKGQSDERRLVLIDWQFMSLSGIGEDLGKLVGANMSLGVIPPHQYGEFHDSVFQAYLDGLRDMGWQGGAEPARYGFCLSAALRSVWEVPQYFSVMAQLEAAPTNTELQERLHRLGEIIALHQQWAAEAGTLKSQVLGACR